MMAIVHPLFSILGLLHLTIDYIRHHSHKCRVIVRAACTDQFDPQVFGDLFRFDVQIIENFDVVADETDGRDDDFFAAFGGEPFDGVGDFWFQPRIARPPATALIGERPVLMVELCCNQLRAGLQLLDVR